MRHPDSRLPTSGDTSAGFAFAVSAYFLWGFLPIYMKALAHVDPTEVVAHRVIWSVPIAGIVLILLGRTSDLRTALRSPRMLGMALLTASLISVNWVIFVWAIAVDRAVDAALGYYINPLFSMALGAIFLGERLSLWQCVAVALAAAAVAVLTWSAGSLPWVAVSLFVSWGFYALCKRQLPIGPNQGFLLEVLILLLPATAYAMWLAGSGQSHFLMGNPRDTLLLLGCGVVTAVPLMLYANGAKRLRLTTIAILQYIAPTMIFLVAVFIFEEPVDPARRIAFPLIWAALVIYSTTLIGQMRRARA